MTVLTAIPPRFRYVPVFSSSMGQDYIDLSAHAGLQLDDWQQDFVISAKATKPSGSLLSQIIALLVSRQNGKGGICECLEVGDLVLDPTAATITHSAHRFDTCLEHFQRIVPLFTECPDLLELIDDSGRTRSDGLPSGIKDSNGKESIKLKNGSRLLFKARERGAGRGFSGDRQVFDEAQILGTLSGMVPAMSARANPQALFFGTAPENASYSLTWRQIIKEGRRLAGE